jgi:arylsulfatase A-like enzyme
MPQGFLLWSWKINGCDRFDAHTVRDIRRAYYACITQIDYALGRLFARLRELNLLDNTMIIFTSDHGEMLGDHHMGGKSVFFEGSAHVPMLVVPASAQGREALRGTTCDALVTLADLYPTCLAAAGVRRAADGHNLLRTARGRVPRKAVLGVCGDGDFALVAGQYKYVYCARGGAELLFDLGEDPYEQRDLIAARSHVRVHTDLRRELVRRLRTVHPPVLRNGDLPRVPVPAAREMRNRWPGFVSFCRPHDVLH